MNKEQTLGIIMILTATMIASISQILLKKSANKQHLSKFAEYFNIFVFMGYFLLFGTTIINVFALRWVPLSLAVALDASGQVFVPVLSKIFLNERINRKKVQGMVIIVIGILIFAISGVS